MKKLTSLLLALIMLFTALTLSGCGERYAIEEGVFRYEYYPTPEIKLAIRSKVNEFSVDNVNLDLYIGLNQVQTPIQKLFVYRSEVDSHLPQIDAEDINRHYLVGLISLSDYMKEVESSGDSQISIEKFHVLKEISHTDVVQGDEYDYYISYFTGAHYNYSHNFVIPKSIIRNGISDDGNYKMAIGILDICKKEKGEFEEKGYIRCVYELHFVENENGTLTLNVQ